MLPTSIHGMAARTYTADSFSAILSWVGEERKSVTGSTAFEVRGNSADGPREGKIDPFCCRDLPGRKEQPFYHKDSDASLYALEAIFTHLEGPLSIHHKH